MQLCIQHMGAEGWSGTPAGQKILPEGENQEMRSHAVTLEFLHSRTSMKTRARKQQRILFVCQTLLNASCSPLFGLHATPRAGAVVHLPRPRAWLCIMDCSTALRPSHTTSCAALSMAEQNRLLIPSRCYPCTIQQPSCSRTPERCRPSTELVSATSDQHSCLCLLRSIQGGGCCAHGCS